VDVKVRVNMMLVAVCIVLLTVAVGGLRAMTGDQSEDGSMVSFEPTGTGVLVMFHGIDAATGYSCRLEGRPAGDVVLDLPGAAVSAAQDYDAGSPLIRSVRAERRTDGPGVRFRIAMDRATLAGIDQSGSVLRLRFEPSVGAEAAASGTGGAATDETEGYRLGPGDKIEISVFGHDDMTKVVEVRGDGTIDLPLIGTVQVAGRTTSEVDDIVTKALGKDYLVDPQVSVDVKEYQSVAVTVLGEVHTPGRYFLKRNMRLIELLAQAGGPTREAGPEVLISRNEGGAMRQIPVDLEHLFSKDNADVNLPLEGGDIVTIAARKAFYIKGEVARPGSYFITNGMTVLKALSVAGGLTQFANRRAVELLRSAGEGKTLEKTVINVKDLEEGRTADIEILPDDIISVPRRIF
jgi:polysaccharide export outer membrane protein